MKYELLNRFCTVDTKLMSRISLKLKKKKSFENGIDVNIEKILRINK